MHTTHFECCVFCCRAQTRNETGAIAKRIERREQDQAEQQQRLVLITNQLEKHEHYLDQRLTQHQASLDDISVKVTALTRRLYDGAVPMEEYVGPFRSMPAKAGMPKAVLGGFRGDFLSGRVGFRFSPAARFGWNHGPGQYVLTFSFS